MPCPISFGPMFVIPGACVIARGSGERPSIVQYYAGPVGQWTDDLSNAWMFCTQEGAEAVRDTIGHGTVLRVTDHGGGLVAVW